MAMIACHEAHLKKQKILEASCCCATTFTGVYAKVRPR
uniref:Uncharacterized protein n=1 Tax=Parascaris equorum TaxID=6256 RepID=A0A914RG86_PAREQ